MRQRTAKQGDTTLFWLTLLVSVLGLVFILDAGYAQSMRIGQGIIPKPFVSQCFTLAMGIGLFFAVRRARPEVLKKWSWGFLGLAFLGLIWVELKGVSANEAQRWIRIGPIQLQPAEFMKLAAVLFLASVLAEKKPWDDTWAERKKAKVWERQVLVPKLKRLFPGFIILVIWAMIEHEKDIGTASVILATAVAMFVTAPVTKKSLIVIPACLAIAVGAFVLKEPYRVSRFLVHPHRWDREYINDESFQTIHSELAMASGGVLGTGVGTGRAKHIIPATTSDFIMATVAEEFGLWGPIAILAMIGGLCLRLLLLAQRASDRFRALFLSGVAWWIGIQACTNMMMANASIPAIGIPFPFISAGGSSIIALWLAIAICDRMSWSPAADAAQQEVVNARRRNGRGHRRTRLSRA